jgi:hypothetical protein
MQNNLEISFYEKFTEMAGLIKEIRRKHPNYIEASKLIPYLNEMAFYVNKLQMETMEKSFIINELKQKIADLEEGDINNYVNIK